MIGISARRAANADPPASPPETRTLRPCEGGRDPSSARRSYAYAMDSGHPTGNLIRFPQRYVDGEPWEPWVDERAIARHFSVSTRTVRRWRIAGMPSLLVGTQRRYRIGEAERWHREQQACT